MAGVRRHHSLTEDVLTVDRAKLWVTPSVQPALVGAAVSVSTARRVGGWADGLITVNQPPEKLREVVEAFREGGGENKPAYLQVHLSWAEDDDTASKIAYEQWRTNVFDSRLAWELEMPGQFEAAAEYVRPEDVGGSVLISSDLQRHIEWLNEFVALGFDGLYLHHVGQEQGPFIEAFGAEVLPAVAS